MYQSIYIFSNFHSETDGHFAENQFSIKKFMHLPSLTIVYGYLDVELYSKDKQKVLMKNCSRKYVINRIKGTVPSNHNKIYRWKKI